MPHRGGVSRRYSQSSMMAHHYGTNCTCQHYSMATASSEGYFINNRD